jgi:predicted nucleic acid-binding protein
MRAIDHILARNKVKIVNTIDINLFIRQAEIEEKHGLSFFDSLIAASALSVDGVIVSDNQDFDRVHGLKRVPLG